MSAETRDSLDPIGDALAELRGIGLLVDRLELGPPPGRKVRRVDVEGQKRGKKAGWYIAHELRLDNGATMIVGGYGIWIGDQNHKYSLRTRGVDLNAEEKVRLRHQQKQLAAEAEREDEILAKEVQERAGKIWTALKSATPEAPYLLRKGVSAWGLGRGRDGGIVVPARNSAGLLTQLQFINAEGEKKFLSGPGVVGSFHLIGTIADELPLVFAEGYATAASIHEATGWPVVTCFNANNLVEVGKRLRPIYPKHQFIFAADDDHEKKRNTGREVVTAAATRLKGQAVFPRFNDPSGRTDFNDVHAEQGLEAVREQLEAAVTPSQPYAEASEAMDKKWADQLVYGRDGLAPSLHNVMVVLTHHPAWQGVFGYNEFAKRVEICRETPYGAKPGWITDNDEFKTAAWFGAPDSFKANIPATLVRQAISAVASERPFHPVRDYLERVHWDGVERIPTFFSEYCSVKQNDVVRGFALNFFIAAVARIFRPGCKADLMLVLEGDQGRRKSTMLEVLAGPGGYADVGQSPTDKDFYQSIQGVWLVEVSEMASFAKAETSHIKRAISVAVDRFRRSYGHHVEDFKRECIFFGTENTSEWQRDATGARRYMPVWVGDIDIEAIADVRDQLWAEAKVRFDRGEPWWILPEGAQAEQDDRYLDDPWMERVLSWLNGKTKGASLEPAEKRLRATASQILSFAIEMDLKKQDRAAQTRVGAIMKRLGWSIERKRGKSGAARLRWYVRPTEDDSPEAGS